jgi:glucose dehydrogenase
MRNKDHFIKRQREHHPQVGIGLFLIVLGLALLVATNDLLHLGGVKEYFTWETALIFIGVLLLLNLRFAGGLFLIALGGWFLLDRIEPDLPEIVRTLYWPSVIIVVGITLIFSSLFKRKRSTN